MASRRFMLGLSIALSVLIHGTLLAIAPRVTLRELSMAPEKPLRHYRVEIRETPAPPPDQTASKPEARAQEHRNGLSTEPGTITDLLKRENEALVPTEQALREGAGIPRLSDRVAEEVVPREHDLAPNLESLSKVDSKIVEIAEDVARQDIDIPRRLVSPSPDRILKEDEFPVMRGPEDGGEGRLPLGDLTASTLASEPLPASIEGNGTPEGNLPMPRYEDSLLPDTGVISMPLTPEIQQAVLAPTVEQVKKERSFEFIDDLLDIDIDTYQPQGEKLGFFRLRISPKKGEKPAILPKDITFVIDASNSIVQHKLDATARAVRKLLDELRPEDRFNVVVFRENATLFRPELAQATPEAKAAAGEFLKDLKSTGQTDVYNALRPLLQTPPRKGVPGIVLVMTDGRPTTGVRDARTIINNLTTENRLGNTVFAFGAGNTVNSYLLDLLAYRNKGEADISSSIEKIQQDLPKFFARVENPILAGLQANYGQIDEANLFPKDVPDFYAGRAVTVYGRYDPAKNKTFTMRLAGNAESKEKEVIFLADFAKSVQGDEQIARSWAFQKIYYLIGEVCRVGEKPELMGEIQQLSKKYNIRTIYSE